MNLSIPLSGMANAAYRMGVSANNVANVNTPGYKARSVVSGASADGGVGVAELREDPSPGPVDVLSLSGETSVEGSNVELSTEAAGNVLFSAAYKANAAVVRTEDDLMGTLLNVKR